ncbi:MAG: dephospho-CoA kinase [Alphaproteobacteria bacterium]
MFLLGLTGSIGMGKSETARIFRRLGVPVYDADAAVHALYAKGGAAVPLIDAAFPGSTSGGAVDRARLSQMVVNNVAAMQRLEEIVHPLVNKMEREFLKQQFERGTPIVVLDIPLLFETQREGSIDAVAVVSAPADVQRARVAARPGMTAEKLAAVLARQMPDVEKRARADFIIETGQGIDYATEQVRHVLAAIAHREAQAWAKRQPHELGS